MRKLISDFVVSICEIYVFHLAAHMLFNFFNRIRRYEGLFFKRTWDEKGYQKQQRFEMNKSTLHLYQLTII